jgi:small subunit ribosomal protein S13
MVYFLNTNINQTKKISVALCQVYGIGKTLSSKICNQLGLNENIRLSQLNDAQIEKISQLINENFYFGTELKQNLYKQKTRLVRISSYRGFRHKQGLPSRGQRTHTNANNARKFALKKNY